MAGKKKSSVNASKEEPQKSTATDVPEDHPPLNADGEGSSPSSSKQKELALRQETLEAVELNPKRKRIDRCRNWIIEQQSDHAAAPAEISNGEPLDNGEALVDVPEPISTDGAEPTLRRQLKKFNEKEIFNSVFFECEWMKCGFETMEDLVYLSHVEQHMHEYWAQEKPPSDGQYCCHWDLCAFQTADRLELDSHVHFHAYHHRIKTYGASLSHLITIPQCNSDSRRRNCIEQFQITFQCEWSGCGEKYRKAQLFFMHVNNHVEDQFPVDKRSSKEELSCQWDGCMQKYKRCSIALEHVRKHSTERTIGCFTCGAIFVSRLKYIDHCRRQVDYHNREFACPECDKLFATKQLMSDHRGIHNKRYGCSLCPMMWPSKKALLYHIRYRHIDEKPFRCTVCDHRTVTKADLEEHILTHDDRRMFRCEEFGCDVAFKCQKSLKKHVDSVHYGASPGIYGCHICESQFKSGGSLSKHLMKKHNLKRLPGYTRFTYRADRDGIYRVPFYRESADDDSDVKQQLTQQKLVPESDPEPAERNESKGDCWTSFAIEKIEPLSKNEYKIELKPQEVLPKTVYRKRVHNNKAESLSITETPDSQKPSTSSAVICKSETKTKTKGSNIISCKLEAMESDIELGEYSIQEPIDSEVFQKSFKTESNTSTSTDRRTNKRRRSSARVRSKVEPDDFPDYSPVKQELLEISSVDDPLVKNIDDFTVMKRYLGATIEKPIVISFEETDSAGSVIRSETLETTEISPENLLQSGV